MTPPGLSSSPCSEGPHRFIFKAAAHAQRAADFIHKFSSSTTTAAAAQVEETCAA